MTRYHIIAEERGKPYAEVEFVGMGNVSMHICYELHHSCLLMNDKGAPEQNASDALRMKLCLFFHSNLVPRWLETYYFLSLGEAELDGRWLTAFLPLIASSMINTPARSSIQEST